MKFKFIYTIAIGSALSLGMQSCYQDMDHPSFNYPEEYIPTDDPLKFHISFEDETKEESGYRSRYENVKGSYVEEGVQGKAYKGASDAYAILNPSGFIKDLICEAGSLTYTFWMKAEPNQHQTGLFSITHKVQAMGNFDLFLDNNGGTSNQAYFKAHLRTTHGGTAKDKWVDIKNPAPEGSTLVDNVFGKWTHIVIRYDQTTSAFSLFKDGEPALLNYVIPGFGPLMFDKANCGAVAIGAFGGLTGESSEVDDWQKKGFYEGLLDECRLYDKALTNAEIKKLFEDKK